MCQSNRAWLPPYCRPDVFLPTVQESVVLFGQPPYLFQDFVGKALAFLQSDQAKKLGFEIDFAQALPCKWKCVDESLFRVDLCLYAFTGKHPFDKGQIGGFFNEGSLGAATHHATCSIDFGGSHVGYTPGPDGGRFGYITRPLRGEAVSTDCGYLMSLMAPFKQIYDEACSTILLSCPEGDGILISIPNELLQPSWSSRSIKLLIDIESLTGGIVPYDLRKPHTHKIAGRSLFYANSRFLDGLPVDFRERCRGKEPIPIGPELTADYFSIYDSSVSLHNGIPEQRLLPYMKCILSSKIAPYPLKAAVTHANLEYNKLVDSTHAEVFRDHAFASFTGVFIDMYDVESRGYVNLYQPIGLALKPAGKVRAVEIPPSQIHEMLAKVSSVAPVFPLEGILGAKRPDHLLEQFTFRPGHFSR